MKSKTKIIKKLAYEIGFEKVGIAPADQPKESKYLNEWLAKKFHGTMTWMEAHKKKRANIRELYPEAQSVICVAQNYFTRRPTCDKSGQLKISRYAWGMDYHKLMKRKLKKLLQNIREIYPDIDGRICVDTAPIMEKNWAAKAGLGWQGKHTNLITREWGSWVFLGEIIINKQLSPDAPAQDMCGSCTRCITACPTDAIIAPYQLDATKCIAYLTIEYWDRPIQPEYAGKFEDYVFGCDICQEVCPWNRFEKETEHHEFYPQNNNDCVTIDELITLDENEFKDRFKKSPVMRTGWQNFLRNVTFAANK